MSTRRASLRIRGTVQGVSFRDSARQEALRLGLTGWVRNQKDGSVELVAEGPGPKLEELIRWCYRGPQLAHVTDVARTDAEATGEFKSFTVEYTS
jgi:acylphosphatase